MPLTNKDFLLEYLPKQIKGSYRTNAPLKRSCWLNVGGNAEVLFKPKDTEDLAYFLTEKPSNIPINVIGVGSNTLIRDGGLKGVVIKLGANFNYINHNEDFSITVGAGTLDINAAKYAAENKISGLEFLAGIPGGIGGAVAMNAGAYGNDIANCLTSVKALSLSGELRTFHRKEIKFDYRTNPLSNDWIFVEAKLQGKLGDKEAIRRKIAEIQQSRSDTQPIKGKTAGSTFKNPKQHKAWQLLDEAGCRGLRVGGAFFSEKHCNFLINDGTATATDIEKLIELAEKRVLETTGITLQREIKVIGEKIL